MSVAFLAGRVIAVDGLDDRLDMARPQHAEVVNFNAEDPVQRIVDVTGGIGIGVDRAARQSRVEVRTAKWVRARSS